MNPAFQGVLDMAQRLAAVELFFLVLWQSRFWLLARQSFSGASFDHDPWWSACFLRIWAAWHLPVLLVQTGVSALFGKPGFAVRVPLLMVAFLLHAANLALIVVAASLFTQR